MYKILNIFIFFFIFCFSLSAQELQSKGNIDLSSQFYLKKPTQKHPNNFTASANLEFTYNTDILELKTKLYAQGDYYDTKTTQEKNKRSFVRLDEFYLLYEMENNQIKVGKNIEFWGALEVRNITDTFNPTDLRSDPFNLQKLGVWNATFTHYTENGELSFIVKAYEQGLESPANPYVYYYFPQKINNIALTYNNNLHTQKSNTRPTCYIKYAASTDTDYPLDFAIILQNGYDSQRYYKIQTANNFANMSIQQNAYIVNKIMTYNTLVVDSTLYKFEASYANVQKSKENNVSDYIHLGLGVEHTLTQVYKEANLGFIGEYYYYDTFDKDKKTDLELFETFQNDLFLGLRYSFNEGNDASIIGGAILDFDYNEQVYYVQYESRIANLLKLNLDYRYIKPSQNTLTAFNLMGTHERLSIKLGYYF